MFSGSVTLKGDFGDAPDATGDEFDPTFSVFKSALYCVVSEASGSARMRTKSSTLSESSSRESGSGPCISG